MMATPPFAARVSDSKLRGVIMSPSVYQISEANISIKLLINSVISAKQMHKWCRAQNKSPEYIIRAQEPNETILLP